REDPGETGGACRQGRIGTQGRDAPPLLLVWLRSPDGQTLEPLAKVHPRERGQEIKQGGRRAWPGTRPAAHPFESEGRGRKEGPGPCAGSSSQRPRAA